MVWQVLLDAVFRVAVAPTELCRVVTHKLIPGDKLRKLDPRIITKELAAKRREETFKRELMVMLASILVENFWRCFGGNRPI